MPRPPAWLLVLLLIGVFVGAAAYVLHSWSDAGMGMPPYSIYSNDRDRGANAAAYVLQQAGWATKAATQPIQFTQARGLLILVQPEEGDPPKEAVPEADAKAMLAWVGQGNTLLMLDRRPNAIYRLLDVAPHTDDTGRKFIEVQREPSGYLRDVQNLSVGSASTLSGPENDEGIAAPLWRVGGGKGAMVVRHGKGRVILVADASLATRQGLWDDDDKAPRDDNYWFLVNVAAMDARDGTVWFDEYHHGFQSGGGFWGYLRYHGDHLLLLPLLLVVGAGVWLAAVRLGPAVPTPQTTETDAVDYASALARLYRQAGARRRLARTLARGFLGALTRQLRLRRNALPAEILSAWWLHAPGPSGKQLEVLLRGVAELRRGDVTEEQLLRWSQGFDQFLKEMEVAEHGRMGLKAKKRSRGTGASDQVRQERPGERPMLTPGP
ncbi:MAG TPA: hypothetical protein VMS17_09220 [Gemmataceae bacterium]|nr:hypothetical protein [Gemmataceae bacterium]